MYCIDTSALIAAWYERYPPDVLPPFWDKMDELISEGRLIAPTQVLEETEKRSKELHAWLKDRDSMFQPLDEAVQLKARAVLKRFPHLVGQRKNRTAADPFVIALSLISDRPVITEEKPTGSVKRPNIPDVCLDKEFKTHWLDLLGLIRQEKWVFS